MQVAPLSEDKLYPKEQSLVDLVAAERMASRKALVYATSPGTRDITERMEQFLNRHGFPLAVLKAVTVAPDRRDAWVEERVKQGVDVLVCRPRLAQTGLDLVDDGWKAAEVVLAPAVEAQSNGHVVELANGNRGEAAERQQHLFPWAEFLAEEAVKTEGHNRKPQPSALVPV